jgi:hypothetical protein
MDTTVHECPEVPKAQSNLNYHNRDWLLGHQATKKPNGEWWWQEKQRFRRRMKDVRKITHCPACEVELS